MQHSRFITLALTLALALSGLGLVAGYSNAQAQDTAPAWLGVAISDTDAGVTVQEVVPGSPADDAGVMVDDVITAVDETAIDSAEQLIDVIAGYAAGDAITLAVQRGDETQDIAVTLGERPTDLDTRPEFAPPMVPPMQGRMNFLGLDLEMTDAGLQVNSIDDNSPLADSDLESGDVITAINGESVVDLAPRALLQAMQSDSDITLTVQRGDEEVEVVLPVAMLLEAMPFGFNGTPSLRAQRPTQLGVSFRTLTAEIAAEEDLAVEQGALIEEVFEDTPAAEAGLQAGDIIVAVDGDSVDEEHTLTDRLYAYEEGDTVTLTVSRDGDAIELEAMLGPNNWKIGGVQVMPFMDSAPHGGRGMMGRMPFQRGGRGFFGHDFGPEFFQNHPFMGHMFEQMPGDGFHFFFGTPDDDSGSSAPEGDTGSDAPMDITPAIDSTSA